MSEPKRLPEEEFKVVVEEAKQFIMNNLKKDNKSIGWSVGSLYELIFD